MIRPTLRASHSLQTLRGRLASALKIRILHLLLRNLTKLATFFSREAKMAKSTLISMLGPASIILFQGRKRKAGIMCLGKLYIKRARKYLKIGTHHLSPLILLKTLSIKCNPKTLLMTAL